MLPPPTRPEAIVEAIVRVPRMARIASERRREARNPARSLARDAPDPVQRFAGGEHDPQAGPERPDDPDRERDAAPFQAADSDLFADHRELAEDRVDRVLPQARVVGEDEAENRGQQEQQREEREEGPVGDQRGQVAALVVAELPADGDGDGQRPVALLESVERGHRRD